MGQMLVLAHQGRGRHFRDHQAGIQARIPGQERRQIEGQCRIDHQGNSPLRNRSDLGNCKRNLIGGKGHRFGVKVATGNNATGLGQNERIVGGGIRLDLEGLASHAQQVDAGSHDLRLAPDAIGILDTTVAIPVAFANLGALHKPPHGCGDLDLTPMTTQRMNFGQQRSRRSHDCVGGQAGRHKTCLRHAPRLKQANQCISGGELGSVDQSEAFLRPENDRRQTGSLQGIPSRQAFSAVVCLSLADQHGSHMGKRCKVPRRTDRALSRNDRRDALREHHLDQFEHLEANSRGTSGQ